LEKRKLGKENRYVKARVIVRAAQAEAIPYFLFFKKKGAAQTDIQGYAKRGVERPAVAVQTSFNIGFSLLTFFFSKKKVRDCRQD